MLEFYEFKLPYPADNGRTAPRRAGGALDPRKQVASLIHGGRTDVVQARLCSPVWLQ